MKFLLAAVASLAVFSGSAVASEEAPPVAPTATLYQFCSLAPSQCQRMTASAWNDACRLSVYVCDGVPAPRLLLMPFIDGLNGLYVDGIGVVYVNGSLAADWYAHAVIAHEMTHYLQDATGARLTRCEREAEAFAITNLILAERGRSDLRRSNWRDYYGC